MENLNQKRAKHALKFRDDIYLKDLDNFKEFKSDVKGLPSILREHGLIGAFFFTKKNNSFLLETIVNWLKEFNAIGGLWDNNYFIDSDAFFKGIINNSSAFELLQMQDEILNYLVWLKRNVEI